MMDTKDTKSDLRITFELGPATMIFILQLVLATLKLTGHVTWKWVAVFSPLLILLVIITVTILLWMAKTVLSYFMTK